MPDEPLPGAAIPSSSEPPLDPEPPAPADLTPPIAPTPPPMPPPPPPAAPPMAAPGDDGGLLSSREQRNMAMLAHLSCLFLSLLGPLVILLLNKDGSLFVEAHAKEAINFQINLLILSAIGGALTIIVVGLCILPVAGLLFVIMPIIAGLRAHGGEMYRYPYTIRFLG